jgi:hypothetical protein
VASPLQGQILNAVNSIRPYLYGSGFKIQLLKFNGVVRQYDPLVELTKDFIPSFDRSGNITLMVMSDEHIASLRETTDLVFDGWVYQLTEPAKPEQGPILLWKATGRPRGSRWIPEP